MELQVSENNNEKSELGTKTPGNRGPNYMIFSIPGIAKSARIFDQLLIVKPVSFGWPQRLSFGFKCACVTETT